jgi:hypothetical protein
MKAGRRSNSHTEKVDIKPKLVIKYKGVHINKKKNSSRGNNNC